jgi:thioredoxin 1
VFSYNRIFFAFFGQARRDDEDKLDFKGGNVHIITSKEGWDQKIAEANRDGKTVSKIK